MKNPFSLEGETALITGGGSGLGFGMARCFVKAGARVVLVGRREQVLKASAKRLGRAAIYECSDITESGAADELLRRVNRRVGPVTILVNNAGNHLKKSAMDTSPIEFDAVMQTHVTAAFSLTRAVLPGMIRRRHGSVLFIASMVSFFGVPNVVAYSAAKSAYLGLVRTLATEVSEHGVRVNAVAPGWIKSPMLEQALKSDPQRKARILQRTPMKRFGMAEDIGWCATYLCSPAAQFVTGVVFPVDGGASIGF